MTINTPTPRLPDAARRILRGSVPVFAAICLSGCASLVFPKSAAPRYTLAPVPATDFQSRPDKQDIEPENIPVRLIVEDPAIEAALNTTGIAISDAPLNYKYLKGVKWSDRAPRLFGLFLRRSFQNSSLFDAIGDRRTIPVSDYILYSDLRSFHVEERRNGLSADIKLHLHVTKIDNTTLGNTLISVQRDIRRGARNDIIIAFDAVAKEVGTEAVNWTYETISAAEATRLDATRAEDQPFLPAPGGAAEHENKALISPASDAARDRTVSAKD